MADDLIAPEEHYPTLWLVQAAAPLTGAVAFAFTRAGAVPAAGATWFTGSWAEPDPASTRTAQLVVAGSAAAQFGAHPGVGDFTVHVRYSDGASVRIRPAGVLRVR